MVKYWPIWAKKGSELGQNCQNHVMLVRSHNKTFFQLSQRCWTKIFLKISKFWSWRVIKSQIGPKKSQNWTKKGQNCVHGSRSQNKAPFSLCQGPWTQFFYEISKFCSSRSNIGQSGPKKYQNWSKIAKTMPCRLEAKIRHFFNLFKGTEQKHFLKFPNSESEGS